MAGAPKGNNNAVKGKLWSDELRKALLMYENKKNGVKRGQALRKVAEQVVELAMVGNKDAWQEIGNRLDGKPHQSMDVTSESTVRHMVINASPEDSVEAWQKKHQVLSGSPSPDPKPH